MKKLLMKVLDYFLISKHLAGVWREGFPSFPIPITFLICILQCGTEGEIQDIVF